MPHPHARVPPQRHARDAGSTDRQAWVAGPRIPAWLPDVRLLVLTAALVLLSASWDALVAVLDKPDDAPVAAAVAGEADGSDGRYRGGVLHRE